MSIKWERSEDGYVDSKDGRFKIHPLYCSCVKPQWFVCKDTRTSKESSWCETQRDAKEWAEQQLENPNGNQSRAGSTRADEE